MTHAVGPPPVDPAVLLGALPDFIVLASAEGVITWVSGPSQVAFGWDAAKLVGRPMYELFAKDANHELHVASLAEVLAVPGVHGPIQVSVVAARGALREMELMVTNALADPAIGALVAIGRDITVRDTEVEDLRRREAWSAAIVRGLSDLVLVTDRAGDLVYVSPAAQPVLGKAPEELHGRRLTELVHPEDLLVEPSDEHHLDRILGTAPGRRPVIRFAHADGTWRRLRVERSPGSAVGESSVLLTCRDVTEERSVADLLSEQTILLERIARGAPVDECLRAVEDLAMSRLPDGDVVIGFQDPDGVFRAIGPTVDPDLLAVLDRVGIVRNGDATPRPADPLLLFRRNDGWDSVLRAASSGRYTTAWVADLTGPDGSATGRVTVLRRSPEPLVPGEVDLLGLVVDLATIAVERHALQSLLAHGALHDDLTGLPNRRYLLSRVRETFATEESRGGLLFVDLDRFKLINDSLGHEAGDHLLREVTARFRRTVRPADVVARVGGDEFVVLCPGLDDEESVARVADRLSAVLTDPVDLPGARVVVSASIGVVHTSGRVEPTELLQDADLAMYDAKQRGRSRVAVFHDGLRDRAMARLTTENALRDAMRYDEMELHYQPVVRLRDGAMVGVEALLRWQHPGVGLIGPGEFVPVATDTGLILPLGRWVIEQAVQSAARWSGLDVAANLSARQLTDVDLVEFVSLTLRAADVAPARLCLEVTEADLIEDPDLVIEQLARFKDLGVKLAIDDFGTGFATLDYLRRFATADILKVDMSFVAGVTDPSSHDLAIVSAAMVLADNLGFETIAEGVETEAQREVLERLGCDLAQGYLFSPPVTADEIDRLLRAGGAPREGAVNP